MPRGSWCCAGVLGGLLCPAAAVTGSWTDAGATIADPDAEPAACVALQALDFSEATGDALTIRSAASVAPRGSVPALCRISGILQTRTRFELLLPVVGWNGGLLVSGCRESCIGQGGPPGALARGYAAAAVETGGGDDSGATRLATLAAKEILVSYYGYGPESVNGDDP